MSRCPAVCRWQRDAEGLATFSLPACASPPPHRTPCALPRSRAETRGGATDRRARRATRGDRRRSGLLRAPTLPRRGRDGAWPAFVRRPRDSARADRDRKSTRLNSSHGYISYAVFCLKKKKQKKKYSKYINKDNTIHSIIG